MNPTVSQEDFFAKVPKAIVYHPGLTGNDVRVYATLSDRAGTKRSSWPSVRRIAADLGLSATTVQKALDKLEELKLIEVERSGGKVNLYHLPLVGTVSETDTPADWGVYQEMTRTVSETDTELEQGTRREPKGSRAALLTDEESTNRIGVWTALEEEFGEATTRTARSGRGKVARNLFEAGATYSEIRRRVRAWGRLFPPSNGGRPPTLTDHALEKHWGQLGKLVADEPEWTPESCRHPAAADRDGFGVLWCPACERVVA